MREAAARNKVDESKASDRVSSEGAAGPEQKQRTLSPSEKDPSSSERALSTKSGQATDKARRWKVDPWGGRQRPRARIPIFWRYDANRAQPSWG